MLTHKIDDIMDYSLMETNTLKLRVEGASVRAILSSIQDMMIPQFDNSMINFSVFVADHVPDIVYIDQRRVKQILVSF